MQAWHSIKFFLNMLTVLTVLGVVFMAVA